VLEIGVLKVAILDDCEESSEQITTLLKAGVGSVSCEICKTEFALASYVYDDMKGNVDVLLIHVKKGNWESIDVARDIQNYFSSIRIIYYSEVTDCAEEIFTTEPSGFFLLPIKKSRFITTIKK